MLLVACSSAGTGGTPETATPPATNTPVALPPTAEPAATEPAAAQPLLGWRHTNADGICHTATFGAQQAAAGVCDQAMISAPYPNADRPAELNELLATYAAFEAETVAGTLAFAGRGTTVPTPVEMRMIAEWASLAAEEVQTGAGDASRGLALTWTREGGIAGFCDGLSLYVSGYAYATSCSADPQVLWRSFIAAEQLAQLYQYVDQFAPFEYEFSDGAVADGMATRLVFSGRGSVIADADQQAAIVQFANDLFNRATGVGGSVVPPARPADVMRDSLLTALNARDVTALAALLSDPFGLGPWRSEWTTLNAAEGAAQLVAQLPAGPAITLTPLANEPLVELDGINPYQLLGPDANVVSVLHAQGWGSEGQDGALLFVVDNGGTLQLGGVIYAFNPTAAQGALPPAGLYYAVNGAEGFRITIDGNTVPVTDSSMLLNPAASLAVWVDFAQPGNPLQVVFLPANVTEMVSVNGARFVGCFTWVTDSTLLCGTRPDAEEDGPNNGQVALVDVVAGTVKVLDPASYLFSNPAAESGIVAYDLGPSDAAIWRYGQRETFDWRAFSGLPAEELRRISSPAIAADGERTAWFVYGDRVHVILFDGPTQSARVLYSFDPAGFGGSFRNPFFSQEGDWLAFEILTADGNGNGLYTIATDESGALHYLGPDAAGPVWLTNNELLFTRQPEGGVSTVVHFDALTGAEVTLALPEGSRAIDIVSPYPYATSPDVTFAAQTYVSESQFVSEAEAEQFPTGEKYRAVLLVTDLQSGRTLRVVDQFRSYGLGWDAPIALAWSADGQSLYFTNAPTVDGCGVAANASDLQQLDLASDAVTEILPANTALYMSISPDTALVAYEAGGNAERALTLTTLPSGALAGQVALPMLSEAWSLGDMSWSPDGRYLLVQQVIDPCSGTPRAGYAVVDVAAGSATQLLAPDADVQWVLGWVDNTNALILTHSGVLQIDVITGDVTMP